MARNRQKIFKQLEMNFTAPADPEAPATLETEPTVDPVVPESPAVEGNEFADIVGPDAPEETPAATPEPGAAEPVVSPAEPVAPEVPAAGDKFQVGSRVFDTKAEADAYVTQLEQERAYRQGLIDAITPTEVVVPDVDPADILFEDPKKAFELFEKKLRTQWDAEKTAAERKVTAANSVKATWDDFYVKHPDLAAHRELVDMVANLPSSQETFGKLPVAKALPELGKATRAYMAKLRASRSGGEELPSDPAVTSGTGGVKIPVTKAPAPVSNFVAEVRQMKRAK